ncbi:MAG: serine/threonine protein kinase [Myxococcales bacterium]|nr:serine/threonine protein kinase [Myxococcales bacterium]
MAVLLPPDPLVGLLVDERYRITARLGQGGMGTVYRCENVRLHARPCAMKVLSGLGTPRERARFEREIRTVSQLRSVHTVLVFDSGTLPDERPYIVMELLEGRELKACLEANGALPLDRAVHIAEQVLAALIEAHRLGIVHRDLKPANLFLVAEGDGEIAKVLDFGIAKQQGDEAPALTRRDTAMGTPRYMAPEQFRGEEATPASDLYALGVVFYEMVTGRLPFREDDPVPDAIASMPVGTRLAWMHLNREAPAIEGISPALAEWLARMMCKAAGDRFADAREAREALREVPEMTWTPASGPTGRASMVMRSPALTSRARRWAPVLLGVAGGLVGLGALIAVFGEAPSAGVDAGSAAVGSCRHLVQSNPTGAQVMRGEVSLGSTPLEVVRPCGEAWVVALALEGHSPFSLVLSGDDAGPIEVMLPDLDDAGVDAAVDAGVAKAARRAGRARAPAPRSGRATRGGQRPKAPAPPSGGADPAPVAPKQPESGEGPFVF